MSDQSRADLLREARRLFDEIEQVIVDAHAYNAAHPSAPIDPDPGGKLRRAAENLAHMLVADTGRGPLATLEPLDDEARS